MSQTSPSGLGNFSLWAGDMDGLNVELNNDQSLQAFHPFLHTDSALPSTWSALGVNSIPLTSAEKTSEEYDAVQHSFNEYSLHTMDYPDGKTFDGALNSMIVAHGKNSVCTHSRNSTYLNLPIGDSSPGLSSLKGRGRDRPPGSKNKNKLNMQSPPPPYVGSPSVTAPASIINLARFAVQLHL